MDALLEENPSTDLSKPIEPTSQFLDFYRIFRGQIEHEDNLIGSRISWFVTSQSFLFSAYAIIASSILPNTPRVGSDSKHVLLVIVPMIAIAASVLILLAILSGMKAMRLLRERYLKYAGNIEHNTLPPIQGDRINRMIGLAAPVLLPVLFLAVWVFLLMRRLF